MRVMKFGGASLRDARAVERSMRLVAREAAAGRVLLVVSAQEGVTAQLEGAAEEAARGDLGPWDALRVRHRSALAQLGLEGDLLDRHLFELRAMLEESRTRARVDRRIRDYVLSFGERMSARIVAGVLRRMGLEASPLDAYDLGLTTASRKGEGALLCAPAAGLRATLEAVPGIPVVTGFLALDPAGHLTTLGPNGSDLTAVWFGEAVQAEEVVLWKAVEGFMTADPDVVPEARRIPVLGREEAVEFAVQGAEVLHAGALEPAARGGIVVRVANVDDPLAPGSRIEGDTPAAGPLGLAHRGTLARLRVTFSLGRDQGAQLSELLGALVEAGLEPERLSFAGRGVEVFLPDTERTLAFVAGYARHATLERGLASFAVIGRGIGADGALQARVHELARRGAVPLEPAPGGSARASQAFLTRAEALPGLLRALHAELFGGAPAEVATSGTPTPEKGVLRSAARGLPRPSA